MLMSVICIRITATVMQPVQTPLEVLFVHAMMDTQATEHFVKVGLRNVLHRQSFSKAKYKNANAAHFVKQARNEKYALLRFVCYGVTCS